MATFNYTTREFREKQALILDKVDAGEDIIIHRGIKKSYMLVPVHKSSERRLPRQGKITRPGKV